jgi:hypothetical protein
MSILLAHKHYGQACTASFSDSSAHTNTHTDSVYAWTHTPVVMCLRQLVREGNFKGEREELVVRFRIYLFTVCVRCGCPSQ